MRSEGAPAHGPGQADPKPGNGGVNWRGLQAIFLILTLMGVNPKAMRVNNAAQVELSEYANCFL